MADEKDTQPPPPQTPPEDRRDINAGRDKVNDRVIKAERPQIWPPPPVKKED